MAAISHLLTQQGSSAATSKFTCAAAGPKSFCFSSTSDSCLWVQYRSKGAWRDLFPSESPLDGLGGFGCSCSWETCKGVHCSTPGAQLKLRYRTATSSAGSRGDEDACFRWMANTHDDPSLTPGPAGPPYFGCSLRRNTAASSIPASQPNVVPTLSNKLDIPSLAPIIFSDDPDKSSPLLGLAVLIWRISQLEHCDHILLLLPSRRLLRTDAVPHQHTGHHQLKIF
jgi:hypothetical protein